MTRCQPNPKVLQGEGAEAASVGVDVGLNTNVGDLSSFHRTE